MAKNVVTSKPIDLVGEDIELLVKDCAPTYMMRRTGLARSPMTEELIEVKRLHARRFAPDEEIPLVRLRHNIFQNLANAVYSYTTVSECQISSSVFA